MIFWLLVSLLVPLGLGTALVQLVWPGWRGPWPARLLKICLAVILGMGLASCLFFLWLLVAGAATGEYLVAEMMIAAVLLGWASLRARSHAQHSTDIDSPPPSGERPHPAVIVVAAIVGVMALAALVISSIRSPHGAYDAWAIWNIHARFLFRGGAHWRDVGLPEGAAHPDYPLLVPALVARCWVYIGRETPVAPAALSCLFTLLAAGILVAALALLRNTAQACLAVVLLLGASHFIYNGAGQTADVPLSVFFLAPLALVALLSRYPHDTAGLAFLAGALAGLAAWTKNEGLLYFLVFTASWICATVWLRTPISLRTQLAPFVLGALPVLLIVGYFKLYLAPPNDLVAGQGGATTIARLMSIGRYWQIGLAYLRWFATFGRGSIAALALYVLCVGIGWKANIGVGSLTALLTVVLMLLGYFLVFVTTPHDLAWHLASFERLLVQLWPALLLTVFLVTHTPAWSQARPAHPSIAVV